MSLAQRVCLLLFLCFPALSWAQNPAPAGAAGQMEPAPPPARQAPALSPRPAPVPTPQNGEGRIKIDVVVTDKAGKPISGLALNDFTLLDNNLPNKILSLRTFNGAVSKADLEADPPVEVILLIDTVNMGFQRVAFVRDQIEKYLRQNGGHLAQPVSLYVLTDQGLDVQRRPSTDGNGMAEEVKQLDNRLRTVGRSAGGWGAIERFQFSVRTLMSIAESEAKKPGRKLLIWGGPGWPMLDSVRFETSSKGQQYYFDSIVDLSTRLREARISVYSISSGESDLGTFLYEEFLKGVKTAEKANPSDLALKVLAVQSGGRVLGPDNDLTSQINGCVEDAGAFYTLSFNPPRADRANEYHDLKVQIDKPGLTARTNTGYYNQP